MTTYTADDFKAAHIARHPTDRRGTWGGFAIRRTVESLTPWETSSRFMSDAEAAAGGYEPVAFAEPITDDTVRRAMDVLEREDWLSPYDRGDEDNVRVVREVLATVATPRPAGAAEIEADLNGLDGIDLADSDTPVGTLADALAALGYRKAA